MVDTVVAEQEPAPPAPHRPRWRSVYVLAPLAFLVLLAVIRIVYWRASVHYAPLRVAGAGVPYGDPSHVTGKPGAWRLTGPAGTVQVIEFAVLNDGDNPVDLNKVDALDPAVTGVQWAANHVDAAGQAASGPSHELPVHVPRHATVRLRLHVTKPACSPGEVRTLSGSVRIRWHAMVSPHVTTLDLIGADPGSPLLTLCGP